MTMVEERLAAAPAISGAEAGARRAMIDSQLRTSGVNAPAILGAFDTVARTAFVSAERRAVAYADRAVPLGGGRVLAPAVTHGLMLQDAAPRPDDKALLIGGGTGYLAAILVQLVGSLTVVEDHTALAARAPERHGDWHDAPLAEGWAAGAPYSLIVIDGAVEQVPATIAAQLAADGRLVTGLVERGVGRLAIGRRSGDGVALAVLGEADVAPLAAFAAPKSWSF